MKSQLYILLWILALSLASAGQFSAQSNWLRSAGGLTIDEGEAVSLDPAGNSYVTGYFTSTALVGGTSLVSAGSDDIFLAKLSPAGIYQWAVHAGGTNSDRALAIATDASGNTYITGFFYSTAFFGNQSVSSAGVQDIFIAKYTTTGTLDWVKRAGGAGSDIGNGICVDQSGNVIVTGDFSGSASFGSTTLTAPNNSINVFTTKLDANGNFIWAKAGTGPHTDRGLGVACDNAGGIYVMGQFSDTITFGTAHPTSMYNVIFLLKYDGAGNEQWFRLIGGGSFSIPTAITCDKTSAVFLTGNFQGQITLFGPPNALAGNSFTNEIFLAKYTLAGTLQWCASDGSNSALSSNSIGVDNAGNSYICGQFKCTLNGYANRYGQGTFNSAGFLDAFVAQYTSAGSWGWSRQLGGKQDQLCNGIAVTGAGEVFLTGSYLSNLIVPVSPRFYAYPGFSGYGNMAMIANVANTVYCTDAYYGKFAAITSAGNKDIFIGKPIDLGRQPYDFYTRSGSGCNRPTVACCINNYYLYQNTENVCSGIDTIYNCSSDSLYAASNTALKSTVNSIGPDYFYSWSNGQNTAGIPISSPGLIKVRLFSADGCYSTSDSLHVVIASHPPKPTISDNQGVNRNDSTTNPVTICGDSVKLIGGNTGTNTYSWTGPAWHHGTTADSMYVDSSGLYIFSIKNAYGCISQAAVTVGLDKPLLPTSPRLFITNLLRDTLSLCEGSSFSVVPYDTLTNPFILPVCFPALEYDLWTVTDPSGNLTYDSLNCGANSGSCSVQTATLQGYYTFKVKIVCKNACGSDTVYASKKIYLTINQNPPAPVFLLTLSGHTKLCLNDTAKMYATGASNYSWSPGGTNADSLFTTVGGVYIVTGSKTTTNAFGCTTSFTEQLADTVYTSVQPVLTMNPPVICPLDSAQLVCVGGVGAYQWYSPNGAVQSHANTLEINAQGLYYCVVTNSYGCRLVSNSINAYQYNTPYLYAQPSTVLCPGDSIKVSVITSDGSALNWQYPLSGSSLALYVLTPGTYTCTVNVCNITTQASVNITQSPAFAHITSTGNGQVCMGDSVFLAANTGMSAYSWLPPLSTQTSMYATQSGLVTLITTDSLGCKATDSVQVTLLNNPLPLPVVSDTTICIGNPITLRSAGESVLEWYNKPSAGTLLGTGPKLQTGTIYGDTVFYVRTHGTPCNTARAPLRVDLVYCPPLLPNVFTPNGDGVNDYFFLTDIYATNFHVQIYDRWGVLIYEWNSLDGKWDGTDMKNHMPVTDGVYFYIAQISVPEQPLKTATGFVELLRNSR